MAKYPIAILITDTHLKESNHKQVQLTYERAYDKACKLNVDVFHLGDNFDSRKSQPVANLSAFEKILSIFKDKKLFSIVGNHDKVDQSQKESYLSAFAYMPNINIISDSYFLEKYDLNFYFLSYFTKEEYQSKLIELSSKIDTSKTNALFTHIDISGFKMNGASISEHCFSHNLFEKFDKVFVGHYHDCSVDFNIEFIGSSIQHNFGESNEKGVRILYSDLSTEIVDSTQDIQSFNTIYISSITELKNAEISNFGNKRIVFSGTKEDMIKITSNEDENISKILSTCKFEFKENTLQKNEISGLDISAKLDKETIINHFESWAKRESIEDADFGLKILKEL